MPTKSQEESISSMQRAKHDPNGASPLIVRRDGAKGRSTDRTRVLAAQEMRAGPSGSDGRVRVQTTGSCSGTTAGVVSVHGKGGTKPVRCVLGRRTRVNRRQRVESEWMPSKPGSDQWPGRSSGDVLLLPGWWPAQRRREPSAGSCAERGNLCRDAKGDLQVVDPRGAEYRCVAQGRTGS